MIPFFILFLYLGIIMIATHNRANDNKTRICIAIICGLGLWVLMALRSWTCGQDLYYSEKGAGYILQYIDIGSSSFHNAFFSWEEGYEPGFKVVFWLIYNYVSPNPQFMLAIISGLEIALIGYTFFKQSSNIALSYIAFACLGLYVFSYSGIRQGLCVAITFFAFNFMDSKNKWKFFAIILIAFTIHRSSIILLPAYFIRDISLNKERAIMGIIAILLFLPVLMPAIQLFSVLIFGKEKYNGVEGGAYGLFLLYIVMFFYSYNYKLSHIEHSRIIMQVRWMCLIAIFLQSSGILSAGALARIAYNYSIFFSLLLPLTISQAPKHSNIRISILIMLFLIAFFVYCNYDGYLNVVPYRFFWEEQFLL